MAVNDETMIVKKKDDEQNVASMILEDVYIALKEKGYQPDGGVPSFGRPDIYYEP